MCKVRFYTLVVMECTSGRRRRQRVLFDRYECVKFTHVLYTIFFDIVCVKFDNNTRKTVRNIEFYTYVKKKFYTSQNDLKIIIYRKIK